MAMTQQGPGGGPPDAGDRPVGELVKELSDQTSRLVRDELELAKLELTEKGKRAGLGAGMFGGAGLFGLFAFAALTTAFIAGLDAAFAATWVAALIVAGVYGAIAGVLALTGKKEVRRATPAAPEQAVESVKEDVRFTTERAKEARR